MSDKKLKQVLTPDNRYVFLNVQNDRDVKGRIKVIFEPPIRITNSLPKDVYI
jgi:hypothetical protein